MKKKEEGKTLWTRDFTIITLGSVVSMLGNSMAGFAMSLMVLDVSKSTWMFAIYMASFTVPQLLVPIFSGAVLDRFSRKKMIYLLDFASAALYALLAVVLHMGWYHFTAFIMYTFVLGCIQSIYMVAFDSFYPLLITEGFYQKAYSIASTLEMLTSFMIPIATFLYKLFGLEVLLVINAVSFLVAAVMETQISHQEAYVEAQKATRDEEITYFRQVFRDLKEGVEYVKTERGLQAIVLYFAFAAVCYGAGDVIALPYFKATYHNGEYLFMLVWGASAIGRMIGGALHYKFALPAKHRYAIALCVYLVINVMGATYLFLPLGFMVLFQFMDGILGVTSYTIRISATQSYVPDEKKGRFNGMYNMMFSGGILVGQLLAGALTVVLSERMTVFACSMVAVLAAAIFIGGNKKHIAPIYNRES